MFSSLCGLQYPGRCRTSGCVAPLARPCGAFYIRQPCLHSNRLQEWVTSIGLDPAKFGTHFLRRTKAVLIYRRTGNLRAVQLLLEHSKIESTVRYLGIEVDDAIDRREDRHLTHCPRKQTWSAMVLTSPIIGRLMTAMG